MPEVTELGFVSEALAISNWVAGLIRMGGVPLTRAGKKFAELQKRRGIDAVSADGWARYNYEKERDKLCPGGKPPREMERCWSELVDSMVSQINPPISIAEWEELKAALAAGGHHMPAGWKPSALSLALPVLPGGGPGGGGFPPFQSAGAGAGGALLVLGLMLAFGKMKGRG